MVAADQAECESLASINTWTDDTCMDNRPLPAESVDGYSDRESCEGTTNNVWTPAVLATPHSCANNGLWNSATDDQVACEMTASGNIWTTSTTIDFDSSTNTYSGICTPKICPSVTIASGAFLHPANSSTQATASTSCATPATSQLATLYQP